MDKRNVDSEYDPEEIEREDPEGEELYAERGFKDGPGGGPDFNAPGMVDESIDKRPGRGGQKVAGVEERHQHDPTSVSEQRPDSGRVVIRERGGASKGDPAVGGTRPD
jgi:hypothetical protein